MVGFARLSFLPRSRNLVCCFLCLQYHFRGRLHVTVLMTAAKVMDHNTQRVMPFSLSSSAPVVTLVLPSSHVLSSEKSVCLVHQFNVGARLDRMHSLESACSITTHEPPVSSITSSA